MTTQQTAAAGVPGIVRFAVWLTFFNTWVLFEETVVDVVWRAFRRITTSRVSA
jgi:hypothetical protein